MKKDVLKISSLMKRFVAEQLEPYGYLKMCYCNGCQKPLRDQQALCANEQCVLYRAPLKRTKLGKRITLHTLLLAPQLKMILKDEGLRLGMRELSCPVSVIALRRNPTPFWLSLGDTDEEREAEFEERKKARARWAVHVRGALQRALNDIRKYVLDANGRLVPAPKVKIIRMGSQPSTSQRTPQDDDEEDDDTAWRND